MKIKMITLLAGPNGILSPGQEVDVSETMALQLINGGYAVAVETINPLPPPPNSKANLGEEIEEAVVKPKEKAVSRKRKA